MRASASLEDERPVEIVCVGGEKVGYLTNVSSRNVWRSTGVDLMFIAVPC